MIDQADRDGDGEINPDEVCAGSAPLCALGVPPANMVAPSLDLFPPSLLFFDNSSTAS